MNQANERDERDGPEGIVDVIGRVVYRFAATPLSDLDRAIELALEEVGLAAQADRTYVTRWSTDGRMWNAYEWVQSAVLPHHDALLDLHVDQFPYSTGLAMSGRVWNVPDLDKLPPEAEAERRSFAPFGVKSVLEIPLRVGEGIAGSVGFNHVTDYRDWSPETIALIVRASDAIGTALTRRQAFEALEAARRSAEEALRAKDRFIAGLSHELRTPLHAVLGFAELLDDAPLNAEQRLALDTITSSALELQRLLDALLRSAELGG